MTHKLSGQIPTNWLPTPLLLNEGFALLDNGDLLATWHIDFRPPTERLPVAGLVKCCEGKHAIELCKTVKLNRPAHFRKEGETLIEDMREGFAFQEKTRTRYIPVTEDERAMLRQLEGELVRVTKEASGYGDINVSITLERTETETDSDSLEWGKDFWMYSTALEPTSEGERLALAASMKPEYHHETHIPAPRTFAQMLGRAFIETYGPPLDTSEPMEHSIDNRFVGRTYHRLILVIHGPVVYVEEPETVCATALADENSLIRTLMPMFVKSQDRVGQREYRFVISDPRKYEDNFLIMSATPFLIAATAQEGNWGTPMVIPAMDTTGVEESEAN